MYRKIATMNLAQTHATDVNALKVIYNSLVLICKVFYSLNFQDLPEFFEDNMQIWMSNFHTLLTADVKCLQNTVSLFFIFITVLSTNCKVSNILEMKQFQIGH
ncbi:hypothetical protein NQ314_010728 [Rhamnusium bicolor]|uniref:Exportin-2 central domain-containing protein n=1 Tax=Rhamnusium bicolor TaxID=1586634 RepID=A0AAV8XMZ3_9CUCU|nr:hypothetical protein NQ314_010728 [Rhamnusium bicolor]